MKLTTIGIPLFLSLFALAMPQGAAAKGRNVLMFVTGADRTQHGKQTGIWLEEFAVPYLLFKKAGYTITVASPKGGAVPVDPGSQKDSIHDEDWTEAVSRLETTVPATSLSAENFDAIFFPGGHGTMFDLPNNVDVKRLLKEFDKENKIIAAVCHGPAAFVGAQKADGTPLVKGRTITGFTDAEETAAGMVEEVPFLLETALRKEGGKFVTAKEWSSHVEIDGRFVTGQNPASSEATAKAVLSLLK